MNLFFCWATKNSWKAFKVFFYHFLSWTIHFSCVCFTIFAGDLISVIYHFSPDLKSLFTVAAISRVRTEVPLKILSGCEAYMHAYMQVQGQTSPIVCLFLVQPNQVLYWFY